VFLDSGVAHSQVAFNISSNEKDPASKRIIALVTFLLGYGHVLQNDWIQKQNFLHGDAVQYAVGAFGHAMLFGAGLI
jgi:hypothetical protein